MVKMKKNSQEIEKEMRYYFSSSSSSSSFFKFTNENWDLTAN